MKITQTKIKSLIPDNRNFNKGTSEGQQLIEKSLSKFGAGRSILIDKNNRIIAGNKTVENADTIGIEDVMVVESDGTKLIAVKRTDIDLNTAKGRELAFADNRTTEVNLEWDVINLSEITKSINNFNPIDWGLDIENMLQSDDVLTEIDNDNNTQTLHNKPLFSHNPVYCNMVEQIRVSKKGDFYVTSLWKKSEDGMNLNDIKTTEMIPTFADRFSQVLTGMLGRCLSHYGLITAPKRRHKENNFSTEVCKQIAQKLGIQFYEDCITAQNRTRINPTFELAKIPEEKNLIVIDDIMTTGCTLSAIYDLLPQKNCFFLVINNS